MTTITAASITVQHFILTSTYLNRDVIVDAYFPYNYFESNSLNLLLINDGQDLRTMQFEKILQKLYVENELAPLLCIAIHCGNDRKNEYGTANILDYKGRGTKAAFYQQFIFEELLPFVRDNYTVASFNEKSFAGFSLGGLAALDIIWQHPHEFIKAGIFSGSLWWRDKDQNDASFDEDKNRIMHQQVAQGDFSPWLKFFFEVGTQDETADRNNNGVIDSIDDTTSLIEALATKGYNKNTDIKFVQLKDGKHDVATWAKALPDFLKWGWGYNNEITD
jgi:enterochelin esterase-like enzyme